MRYLPPTNGDRLPEHQLPSAGLTDLLPVSRSASADSAWSHRQANLPGCENCSLNWLVSLLFDEAGDVFEHYDRIIDDVARKAGVNKTTVYRRWPTKDALVQAAFERFGGVPPVVNMGSLRDDLRILTHFKLELLRTNPGKALMRGLLAEAFSPELLEISRRLRVQDVALYSGISANARTRGELRKGIERRDDHGRAGEAVHPALLLDGRLPTDATRTACSTSYCRERSSRAADQRPAKNNFFGSAFAEVRAWRFACNPGAVESSSPSRFSSVMK